MRIGVIGCGRIAQTFHLPHLSEIEGVEIAALSDVNIKVASNLARKYNVLNVYADYNDLITKSKVDAILNLTPNPFHKEVSIKAMRSGISVLTEKPMALTVSDGQKIIDVSKEEDVILMVGYHKRYDPIVGAAQAAFQGLKDCNFIRVHIFANVLFADAFGIDEIYKFEKGLIPKIVQKKEAIMTDSQVKQQFGTISAQLKTTYLLLLGVCCHDINMFRFLLGEPTRILKTEVWDRNVSGAPFALPSVISLLEFKNNARCVFEFSTCWRQRFWDETITAYSPTKMVEVRYPFNFLRNFPTELRSTEGTDNVICTGLTSSYHSAYKKELLYFVDCLEKKREPITSGLDAKRDIEIVSSIVESYLKNRTQSL